MLAAMQRKQAPIDSGFSYSATAREVLRGISLEGRTFIVTGGHAGIGLETTKALAESGATVVVGARNVDAAKKALAGVPRAEAHTLELADPASVDAFAHWFVATERPLHVLINNAGIMAVPLSRDRRGLESHLAVNHVGHAQLTQRLLPSLAKDGRVVCLTSRGHRRSGFDFDDPSFERRPYDKWVAYGQSKTANVLFAVGLATRGVHAFAVHPGGIITGLIRHMSNEEADAALANLRREGVEKNVEQGAATTVWAATSPKLRDVSGVYCEDCNVAASVAADDPNPNGVRPWAIDPEAAERLWEWTQVPR
jgi:NAD(P)-dependent dehydrogenase (short-subunit alcohol dehydrogenase family)